MWFSDQRVPEQPVGIQITTMHVYSGDLPIFVSGVVIDPFVAAAAAGVYRFFETSSRKPAAAVRLTDSTENVEKLVYTAFFRAVTAAVPLGKCGADKSGLGRQVTGKPDCAHTVAVGC